MAVSEGIRDTLNKGLAEDDRKPTCRADEYELEQLGLSRRDSCDQFGVRISKGWRIETRRDTAVSVHGCRLFQVLDGPSRVKGTSYMCLFPNVRQETRKSVHAKSQSISAWFGIVFLYALSE